MLLSDKQTYESFFVCRQERISEEFWLKPFSNACPMSGNDKLSYILENSFFTHGLSNVKYV